MYTKISAFIQIVFALFVLITISTNAFAGDGIGANEDAIKKSEDSKEFSLTASVPTFKFRQGEDFKVFDGAAGGIKWYPWFDSSDSLIKNIQISGIAMISTFDAVEEDTSDTTDTKQIHVFSAGAVVGIKWFQLGVGWDLVSSENKEAFKSREKMFYLVNLTGSVDF